MHSILETFKTWHKRIIYSFDGRQVVHGQDWSQNLQSHYTYERFLHDMSTHFKPFGHLASKGFNNVLPQVTLLAACSMSFLWNCFLSSLFCFFAYSCMQFATVPYQSFSWNNRFALWMHSSNWSHWIDQETHLNQEFQSSSFCRFQMHKEEICHVKTTNWSIFTCPSLQVSYISAYAWWLANLKFILLHWLPVCKIKETV